MQNIQLPANNSKKVIEQASVILGRDGLVVLPSDTVLGLLAKVSKAGIAKLDKFKKRRSGKNYSLIFSDTDHLQEYLDISEDNMKIVTKNSPGLFTFVVKPIKIINKDIDLILGSDHQVGFRIPTSELMRKLAIKCNFPIVATSANLSGKPSVYNHIELIDQVWDKINDIDLIIESDTSAHRQASTVIDLTGPSPTILREGSGKLFS